MSPFRRLALELDTSDRTLRRAADRGTVRARRLSPRRAEIPAAERTYLRGHWDLLSRLLAHLRTERNVRAAVLFGSAARGTDSERSDVDIAVVLAEDDLLELAALEARLSRALERRVDLVRLGDAEEVPGLLGDLVEEGRTLIDRDGIWAGSRSSAGVAEPEAAGEAALREVREFLTSRP